MIAVMPLPDRAHALAEMRLRHGAATNTDAAWAMEELDRTRAKISELESIVRDTAEVVDAASEWVNARGASQERALENAVGDLVRRGHVRSLASGHKQDHSSTVGA